MTVRVKICGINDAASFDTAVEAGADWIGLNFFPPSPRYTTPAVAAALAARHMSEAASGGGAALVGLFVEPDDADVAATLAAVPLDVLQIYASAARAAAIRATFGKPVWRAIGVATANDLPASAIGFDGFVVEAKPPPGATRPGGNAVTFDWTATQGWAAPRPWLLAGGLTPDTVREAISVSGAIAVDVSSGVESARGIKDAGLIRSFIRNAKGG